MLHARAAAPLVALINARTRARMLRASSDDVARVAMGVLTMGAGTVGAFREKGEAPTCTPSRVHTCSLAPAAYLRSVCESGALAVVRTALHESATAGASEAATTATCALAARLLHSSSE